MKFLSRTYIFLIFWAILVLFVVVPLILGNFALHRVKKDSRG